MFHSLGKPDESQDGQQPPQVAPPQFNPAIAQSPEGYQQNGSSAGAPQSYGQPGYAAPGVQQPPYQDYGQPTDQGLASQFGGMSVSDPTAATAPRAGGKKKNRHAFHTLEAPPPGPGAAGAYGAAFAQSPGTLGYAPNQAQEPNAPGVNQFPAAANAPFNPINPASPLEHAARASGGTNAPVGERVDADQIPSVPPSRDLPAKYYIENVYPTMERHLPPPAAIPFIANDQGNSSPKFCRLTTNSIPPGADALAATKLPLGLLLQPLASLQEGELPIPVLDFGQTGPPRCARCRAYINPFMNFISGGNKFVCNMCTFPNDVPAEYFAPTSPSGVRVDRDKRPELHRGTVEFTVPKEYWAKEPVPLRWLFLIDVSQESFNKGLVESVCEGITRAVYGEKKLPEGAKVGIVTYDKEIHFYNLSV
jgi:protein transport protein SEC24